MQTYLFYDIETTGLSKSFDQVLHFAAIRTDLQLKEIDRHEIKIKLNPDVIPSPYALITHKMGIHEILKGESEFEAIKHIHTWLNTPGTISLGYNTLGFDDEFLRFSFYRNLLKPYTHQFANQCYRMDIYPMAVMFFLYKKNVLAWPEKNFKLENINAANKLISGRSHHAMVDVEVTLELARRLQTEHDMWEYLHGYFQKETDSARMQQAQNEIALCINGKMGSDASYQCAVLFLGNHHHYKNQSIWLRLDNIDFREITTDTIAEKTWGISKKPGEPNFILPCKPRFMQHMQPDRLQLAEQNRQWLLDHSDMFNEIKQHHLNFKYPEFPQADSDSRLYINGFFTNEEIFFCQRFHSANLKTKIKMLQETDNPRLKNPALRIIGRQDASLLSAKDAEEFADYLRRVMSPSEEETLIDFQGKKRMTPKMALQEIATIRTERVLDVADSKLLDEFETYLHTKT